MIGRFLRGLFGGKKAGAHAIRPTWPTASRLATPPPAPPDASPRQTSQPFLGTAGYAGPGKGADAGLGPYAGPQTQTPADQTPVGYAGPDRGSDAELGPYAGPQTQTPADETPVVYAGPPGEPTPQPGPAPASEAATAPAADREPAEPAQETTAAAQDLPDREPATSSRVKLIMEDGTMASPSLDPQLEDRLRYIVDNIVPPSTPPSA